MKIIRVVCTADGVCREPGDIIEKAFTPDESMVVEAAREAGGAGRYGRLEFAESAGRNVHCMTWNMARN